MKQYSILIILIFVLACTEVFEDDLSNSRINLHTPPDKFHSARNTTTFWWEEVDHATSYNIQIVEPRFNYIEELISDSSLNGNKFTIYLEPGKYEWRVEALNNNYSIYSEIRSFQIDSGMNITDIEIRLIQPPDNWVTNSENIKFLWEEYDLLSHYKLEIRSPDWNGSLITNPILTNENSFSIVNDSMLDGFYEWGIQGQNSESLTSFSRRKFTIDRINPAPSVPVSPLSDDTLSSGQIEFSWNRPSDKGSSVEDSFFIYKDSFQNQLLIPPVSVSATTNTLSLGKGTYFWQLVSFDLAGNTSGPSNLIKINVE